MGLPRFVLASLLAASLSQAAIAQEPVRQKTPAAYPTRDSLSKKAIEEQYAVEINKCRSQISILNKEIVELDKKIEDLKMASAQAEKDYNTWLVNYEKSPGRKDPQTQWKKYYELQKKLKDTDAQIDQCVKEKKVKLALIKELQLQIVKLGKDRDVLLKKIN